MILVCMKFADLDKNFPESLESGNCRQRYGTIPCVLINFFVGKTKVFRRMRVDSYSLWTQP